MFWVSIIIPIILSVYTRIKSPKINEKHFTYLSPYSFGGNFLSLRIMEVNISLSVSFFDNRHLYLCAMYSGTHASGV